MHYSQRSPIGFLVEGRGEYQSFPALACRWLNCPANIPCVQTDGYGGITKRFDEFMDALVLPHKPVTVIVCIDLIDVIKAGLFADCKALADSINSSANSWLSKRRDSKRFNPLPEYIRVVIQIPKFESWLVAGSACLIDSGVLKESARHTPDCLTDVTCPDPCGYLEEHAVTPINTKNPAKVSRLLSICDLGRMRSHSQSFNKWTREVKRAHDNWTTLWVSEFGPCGAD